MMAGRVWIGLLFIVFGTGFLLHQVNVWDFTEILYNWWPLIFIVIGCVQLINFTHARLSGILFIFIGSLFLLNQWGDLDLTVYIWPLILIAVGIWIMFARSNVDKASHVDDLIQTFSLFSGADVRCQSPNFKGGNVTSIFGGIEIDMREATLSSEGAALDLLTIFGGVTITVPKDVRVEIKGVPLFGGWENNVKQDSTSDRVLFINCLAVFSGVEIEN